MIVPQSAPNAVEQDEWKENKHQDGINPDNRQGQYDACYLQPAHVPPYPDCKEQHPDQARQPASLHDVRNCKRRKQDVPGLFIYEHTAADSR